MIRLRIARQLGHHPVLDWLEEARRRAPWPLLTALTYHRIAESKAPDEATTDVHDATCEQFDEQLAVLSRAFSFVTARDLADWTRGAALPPNPVMITFDDGYLECHTRALPILLRHGARATFFVSPGLVDERRMFWWDRIEKVLASSPRQAVELTYPRRVRLDLGAGSELAARSVLDLVKTTPGLHLERLLAELEAAAEVEWSTSAEADAVERSLMTWDQIRDLERHGMDVESHTRHHRVLQTLAPEPLFDELASSRRMLEERLGRSVVAVAYPVGYDLGPLDHLRRALMAAGYSLGFTNHTGTTVLRRAFDPYGVRRIAMSRQYATPEFRSMVLMPLLAPTRGRRSRLVAR